MKEKVRLNTTMIAHIDQVFGLSMRALCMKIGIPVNTFTHWTDQGTIRVTELVRICNLFHIPFRAFLCFGDEDSHMKTINTISITADEFKPVVFHYDRIRTCGKYAKPTIPVTTITSLMGISFNKFKRFYSEDSAVNLTVDLFIQLCEVTGLPLTFFLDDDSWDVINRSPKSDKKPASNQPTISADELLEQVMDENRKLVEQLKKMNRRLTHLEQRLESTDTCPGMTRSVHPYGEYPSDHMQAAESKHRHNPKGQLNRSAKD